MKKSEVIKETIITATIELILNSDGNQEEISSRAIAKMASTSAASINYHFQSKDNLIKICIQRVISDVVSSFKPDLTESDSVLRFKKTVKNVADFLVKNEAISRISILDDLNNPHINDNSTNSMRGFLRGLDACDMDGIEKMLFAFMITSIIQSSFLRKNISKELLGFDFTIKMERDMFIDLIIDKILVSKK